MKTWNHNISVDAILFTKSVSILWITSQQNSLSIHFTIGVFCFVISSDICDYEDKSTQMWKSSTLTQNSEISKLPIVVTVRNNEQFIFESAIYWLTTKFVIERLCMCLQMSQLSSHLFKARTKLITLIHGKCLTKSNWTRENSNNTNMNDFTKFLRRLLHTNIKTTKWQLNLLLWLTGLSIDIFHHFTLTPVQFLKVLIGREWALILFRVT